MRQAVIDVSEGAAADGPDPAFVTALVSAGLVDFEALACDGDRVTLQVVLEESIDVAQATDLAGVEDVECVDRSSGTVTYVIDYDICDVPCGPAASRDEADGARAPPRPTVDYDGVFEDGMSFELTGAQSVIGELVDDLEAAGADVTLRTLQDYDGPERPLDGLTERQRTVLEVAYDVGYFDVPREASLEAVARELDLDRSTVSEHLQRAERNLLDALLPR